MLGDDKLPVIILVSAEGHSTYAVSLGRNRQSADAGFNQYCAFRRFSHAEELD